VPPYKKDHMNQLKFKESGKSSDLGFDRFDSVSNIEKAHVIIYDFNKQYPGYLISYI
jgi:hypothetical protein